MTKIQKITALSSEIVTLTAEKTKLSAMLAEVENQLTESQKNLAEILGLPAPIQSTPNDCGNRGFAFQRSIGPNESALAKLTGNRVWIGKSMKAFFGLNGTREQMCFQFAELIRAGKAVRHFTTWHRAENGVKKLSIHK